MKTQHFDVVVIGGGLAGGVTAARLTRSGLSVALFERETQAHPKVCGEFLSVEAVPWLSDLGIDLAKLGASRMSRLGLHGATQTRRFRLARSGEIGAFGYSRENLDSLLLRRSAELGADVRDGVTVLGFERSADRSRFSVSTSVGLFSAARVVVATGKFDLKGGGWGRGGVPSHLIGFKGHLRVRPSVLDRLKESVELYVFKGGYGGLAPIEGDRVNFCFLIDKNRLREMGAQWPQLSLAVSQRNWQLSHDLDGAELISKSLVTCPTVPYGFLRRKTQDGVYFVGDQAAVIPSLTGDGMAMAIQSAVFASDYIVSPDKGLKPAESAHRFQRDLAWTVEVQMRVAGQIHRVFLRDRAFDWALKHMPTPSWLVPSVYGLTRSTASRDIIRRVPLLRRWGPRFPELSPSPAG